MGIGSPRLRQLARRGQALAVVTVAGTAAGCGEESLSPAPTPEKAGAAAPAGPTPTERAFVRAINAARSRNGAATLRSDGPLLRAARAHSTDMVARDYLSHGPVARRLVRFGVTGPRLGENIGWFSDPASAVSFVVDSWLHSPTHRTVMLRPAFRRIGVGVAVGAFKGDGDALVVTADFAGR